MTIDTVRLPEEIERDAVGGPTFNTSIATTNTGIEIRNQNWTRQRHVWQISYGLEDVTDGSSQVAELIEFFYARKGRARGFLFKDWTDYNLVDEQIGTGNGTQTIFQIIKNYSSGAVTYSRKITRVVSGTLVVKVNDVVTGAYSLSSLGVLTLTTPPTAGHSVKVTCEFDIPVRFDNDDLNLRAVQPNVMSVEELTLVELLE